MIEGIKDELHTIFLFCLVQLISRELVDDNILRFNFFTTDYNECAIDNGGCDQICINTIMGQKCECDEGYSLDSDGSSCIANAQCIDGMCECLNGFIDDNSHGSGSGSVTRVNCVGKSLIGTLTFLRHYDLNRYTYYTDIDECSAGYYSCENNSYCVNTIGSYHCQCNHGYEGDGNNCSKLPKSK